MRFLSIVGVLNALKRAWPVIRRVVDALTGHQNAQQTQGTKATTD